MSKKKPPTPKAPRKPRIRRDDNPGKLLKKRFARRIAAGMAGTHAVLAEKPHLQPDSAAVRATEWKNDPEVQAEIRKAQAEAIDYLQQDVNVYFEQLDAIARFDPATAYDDKGHLLPIAQMPARTRMAIQGMDVVMQNVKAGDGIMDEVVKVKLVPKIQALELILKAHGKLITRTEKGKPGEFDKLDREQTLKELEKLAPSIGLRLVKAGT